MIELEVTCMAMGISEAHLRRLLSLCRSLSKSSGVNYLDITRFVEQLVANRTSGAEAMEAIREWIRGQEKR